MFDNSSPERKNRHTTRVALFAALRKDEKLERSGIERI